MSRAVPDSAVERYLDRVRASLRGLHEVDIDEIVLELRGHIAERSEPGQDVEAALRSLGDPAELAREYRVDRVTTRAECGASPIVVLHSLLLIRGRSLTGWLVLALTALGYAWAFALGAASIEKILSPHDVGLWYRPGASLMPRLMIDGPGPAGTRELLGWWFVPLGLAAGAVLFLLTRQFGLWRIRRFRETQTR
jgi:hypothetical protein